MSGIDEQKIFCACGKTDFPYWQIKRDSNIIGYMSSDAWVKKHLALCAEKHVSLRELYFGKELSVILKVVNNFSCNFCLRNIKEGHTLFPRMKAMLSNYYLQEGAYQED